MFQSPLKMSQLYYIKQFLVKNSKKGIISESEPIKDDVFVWFVVVFLVLFCFACGCLFVCLEGGVVLF